MATRDTKLTRFDYAIDDREFRDVFASKRVHWKLYKLKYNESRIDKMLFTWNISQIINY